MHHISKSIYLRQVKVTNLCSASQNLSKKTCLSVRRCSGEEILEVLTLSSIDLYSEDHHCFTRLPGKRN